MLEINPLFKTSDEKIIAVDCKMNLDDNAMMRHPELEGPAGYQRGRSLRK